MGNLFVILGEKARDFAEIFTQFAVLFLQEFCAKNYIFRGHVVDFCTIPLCPLRHRDKVVRLQHLQVRQPWHPL